MELQVEAAGETVGEAKWAALRELEERLPGLDKGAVRFQVVSEGERGLLGVGHVPARVIATVSAEPVLRVPREDESELAAEARALVERVDDAIGVPGRIDVEEDDERITVTCTGPDLGMLIGRHGQTLDALQELMRSAVQRQTESRCRVMVDIEDYRKRRRAQLADRARTAAAKVSRTGKPERMEPMNAYERKIVHDAANEAGGVETSSEGEDPDRFVVIHKKA